MPSRKTGVTDEINIVEESGSTDITGDLGLIQSAGWDIDDPAERGNSVGGGTTTEQFVDGLIIPRCSLSVAVPDWEALKLLGTYDSGAGTISLDDTLPKFTFKAQATSDEVLEITGVKWGRATINASTGDMVTIDFEGIGTDFSFDTGTIDTTIRGDTVANWIDIEYQIANSAVGSVDSMSATYERSLEAVRGIESQSTPKRVPDEVIEKMKDIQSNSTIEITDATAWKEVHDDDTLPVEPVDSRSNVDVAFVIDGGGTLNLTGGKFENESGDMSDDNEIRTVETSYIGQDADVEGL